MPCDAPDMRRLRVPTNTRKRSGQPPRHRRRSWATRLRTICLACGVVSVGVPLVIVLLLRWLPPPTTAFMLRGAPARANVADSAREVYRWTDWDQIAPYAALAVIAAEDQQFLDHHGFDVEAIRVALGDAGRGVVARLDADVKQSNPGPGRTSAADAVGQGPTEFGHPIQDVAREQCLGLPPAWRSGSQTTSDDRFVPEECTLHARLEMVPRCLFPSSAS